MSWHTVTRRHTGEREAAPARAPMSLTALGWWLGVRGGGGGTMSLGWQHPLPSWAWTVIVLAALGFAAWSYHRLVGPRRGRGALAVVRWLVLLAAAVLLAGPMVVQVTREVEPDTLIVLLDRSASMQIKDTLGPHGHAESRAQAVDAALSSQSAVFGDKQLGRKRKVMWLGFGGQTFPIGAPGSRAGLGKADRDATRLRTAIDQALGRVGGGPIAGVVLLSDGQTDQSTGAGLVRRLDQSAVSVFAVPVGAEHLPMDLILASVRAPARSFKGDLVPISVVIDQVGGAHRADPAHVRVQLLNQAGDVLDSRTLAGRQLGEPMRLAATGKRVGQTHWRVKVTYSGGAELNQGNNERAVRVDVVDRPIRVLYVEGYPRWEYRYLKNLLVREKSISSSILLLSSNSSFAQEGNVPIRRFPDSAKELGKYDVIILGDIAPGALSVKQLGLIRDHVSRDGAGLLWIGGGRDMPRSWSGTALSALLPMRDPGAVDRLPVGRGGIVLRPTAEARRLSVLRLRGPDISKGQSWPSDLPPLRWAERLGALKPTAEVLARGYRAGQGSSGAPPLVVRLRYGAGQSLYVGTDGTWRWRYGRGDIYFQQFWIQLIRMLGRGRLAAGAGRAVLSVSKRAIHTGDTVVVELSTSDPAIMNRQLNEVQVQINKAAAGAPAAVGELTLRLNAGRSSASRQVFTARWQPTVTGKLTLAVGQGGLADLHIARTVTVTAGTWEMRHPQTDFARLAKLAQATGGAVVKLDDLHRLDKLVPERARIDERRHEQAVWDSPLALAVLVLLLGAEWIGRKAIRLV